MPLRRIFAKVKSAPDFLQASDALRLPHFLTFSLKELQLGDINLSPDLSNVSLEKCDRRVSEELWFKPR